MSNPVNPARGSEGARWTGKVIYAFDHQHKAGERCSYDECDHARRSPVLAGSEVFRDVPMPDPSEGNAGRIPNSSDPR